MNLLLRFKDSNLNATLVDSPTSRDFVSLLPLTLNMGDLFRREKFAHLPRTISEGGKHTHVYRVGDLAYWPPGPDVAVFYRHDGQTIPGEGIIVIGTIAENVALLDTAGSLKVTIELAE